MYVWYLPYTRAIFENFECTTQGSNSPFVVMASRSLQHSTRGHHVILSTAACRKEIVAIAIHETMSLQEHFVLHTCDFTKRQEEDHQQISQMARSLLQYAPTLKKLLFRVRLASYSLLPCSERMFLSAKFLFWPGPRRRKRGSCSYSNVERSRRRNGVVVLV